MKTVTQAVEALVRATVAMTDEDMGRPWAWGEYDEEGLRFALLMTHHELRDLAVRLAAMRDAEPTQAARILGQYHQAYRDMTAVLATVRSEDLDQPPGPDEWPVRDVLLHMYRAEHGFLARITYALAGHRPERWGDADEAGFLAYREQRYDVPDDALAGTIGAIRDRWHEIHTRVLSDLGDVTNEELDSGSWFWDGTMPVRFRMHRFEEHLRQHTVQLDKTLAGIGRPPTEAQRLVRNLYDALADVEIEHAPAPELHAAAARTIEERIATLAG